MSFPASAVAWSQSPLPPPTFVPVPARTTLARPSPAPVDASPPAKPHKVEWPPAVREYVGRAFEDQNAIAGISRDDVTQKLKEIIGFFAERSQLESVEWKTHPLPQDILRDEQAAARAQADALANAGLHSSYFKKRKSQDGQLSLPVADVPLPPWRKTNLEDRVTYPPGRGDKRHKKNTLFGDLCSKFDQADLDKRKQRFLLAKSDSPLSPWTASRHNPDSDMSTAPVVGTNQSLEKSYFRLTAPPKPETVRPQHVLEKTLSMLIRKWRDEKNYNYMCNQFKSLRQDLTVQHIKNAFTVKVYEIHARIALEKGDLGEYNQCQTQLKALYSHNLWGNPAEFTAYRILYFVYTCNKTDMNDLLAELTPADKTQPWIRHALDVRSSLALGNYHRFFQLYLCAENMGSYLMDMFIERERLHALANFSRAYMTVPLRFLTDELSFENDDRCREFLEAQGAQSLVEAKVDDQGQPQFRVRLKEAAGFFEGLRQAAFSKVDIKGQI